MAALLLYWCHSLHTAGPGKILWWFSFYITFFFFFWGFLFFVFSYMNLTSFRLNSDLLLFNILWWNAATHSYIILGVSMSFMSALFPLCTIHNVCTARLGSSATSITTEIQVFGIILWLITLMNIKVSLFLPILRDCREWHLWHTHARTHFATSPGFSASISCDLRRHSALIFFIYRQVCTSCSYSSDIRKSFCLELGTSTYSAFYYACIVEE